MPIETWIPCTVTGHARLGEAQIAAALASLPGSKLFVYEIPREPDDAVRVHLYSPDGTGRIVYVHPETLAILKTVPHTARFTEIVRTIHGELLAGRTGSILIELAASWAIVMLITGLYLWWPRESRGAAGVLYPRLRAGTTRLLARPARRHRHLDLRTRDVPADHRAAVDHGLGRRPQGTARVREPAGQAGLEPEPRRRTRGAPARGERRRDRHAAHARSDRGARRAARSSNRRCASIYRTSACPSGACAPRRRTARWCASSSSMRTRGAVLSDQGFDGKPMLDRVIGVGIAAHEGQLFGIANQLLGLATALGLIAVCVSAVVMWWRRRPDGALGVPAPRVEGFTIRAPLMALIVCLAILLPVLGASLLVLWGTTRMTARAGA